METPEAYRLLIADVYELAGASRRTSEKIAQGLGQTVARWHLLSVLSADAMTVATAARRLGLARQSVQRVADALAADGLVTAKPNPDHKTAPLLATSPSGQQVLAQLVAASDEDRGTRLARTDVTAQELAAARATVRKVLGALAD